MFDSVRNLLVSNLSALLPPLHADLIAGVILGVNSFPPDFYNQLKTAGLVHVVVVSGYNINVVTQVLLSALKGLSLRFRVTATLLFIALYVALTGFSAPTIRSALMAFIALVAQILGKPTWGLYSLGLSAFLMLFIDPGLLESISFQLTFSATLGILLFEESFFGLLRFRLPSVLKKDLSTSLAAQVFVLPIILYNFGTISFISPVANMLTLWTVPLMTYLGFIVLGLSLISLPLASLASWILYPFTFVFVFLAEFFAHVPYASTSLGRTNLLVALGVSLISFSVALGVRIRYLKTKKGASESELLGDQSQLTRSLL